MITNEYHLQNQSLKQNFELDHNQKLNNSISHSSSYIFSNQVDEFLKSTDMYDEKDDLNSSLDNISKWEDFNESLNYYLAVFTFNDATCLIREFIKLEEYLNCEFNVNERERNMDFSSQEKLREYLNQNLNVIKKRFLIKIVLKFLNNFCH